MKGKEWYQTTEVAAEYDDKRFSKGGQLIDAREREAVLSALEPVEESRILEIAAGTGRFSVMLANQGADVTGIDISAAMLHHGHQRAHNEGVKDNVEFIRGDAARLPFPDNHFDAVFAMRFFHLAPTPEEFLSEMRRVTKGRIFFDTFNAFSTRSIYNWLLPMGSRLYSRDEVFALLESANLELVHAEHDFLLPYGFYRSIPGSIARPLRRADKTLGHTPIGDIFASVSFWQAQER